MKQPAGPGPLQEGAERGAGRHRCGGPRPGRARRPLRGAFVYESQTLNPTTEQLQNAARQVSNDSRNPCLGLCALPVAPFCACDRPGPCTLESFTRFAAQVHYQVPASADLYVHRSGRTARAAADGIAVCVPCPVTVLKLHCRHAACNELPCLCTLGHRMPGRPQPLKPFCSCKSRGIKIPACFAPPPQVALVTPGDSKRFDALQTALSRPAPPEFPVVRVVRVSAPNACQQHRQLSPACPVNTRCADS
jgi:hypothetical protein